MDYKKKEGLQSEHMLSILHIKQVKGQCLDFLDFLWERCGDRDLDLDFLLDFLGLRDLERRERLGVRGAEGDLGGSRTLVSLA